VFRFIRPSGGFKIIIIDSVKQYIDSECSENQRLRQFFDALFERMKMTALKEGEEIRDGKWSFIAEGSPKLNVPTIQVLFTHTQTTLTIFNALVLSAADEDPDEDE
jgi:hypothetical protein